MGVLVQMSERRSLVGKRRSKEEIERRDGKREGKLKGEKDELEEERDGRWEDSGR